MTTERRRARGSGLGPGVEIDGAIAPAELFDPTSPVWQTNEACLEWCRANGIKPPSMAAMRFGFDTHPANRRNHAAESWAEGVGVLLDDRFGAGRRASWHKLRAAGLIS